MPDRYQQDHTFAVPTLSSDGIQLTLDTRIKQTVTYSAFKVDVHAEVLINCIVARWNMALPGQHMLWKRYTIQAVHLRPMEGSSPAVINVPGATHELHVLAIDPEYPQRDFESGGVSILTPPNYCIQIVCSSDQHCAWLVEQLAKRCVEYHLLAEIEGIRGAKEMWDTKVTSLLAEQAAAQ